MKPHRTAALVLLPLVLVACATTGPTVRSLGPAIPVPTNPTSDAASPAPTLLVRLDVGYLNNPGHGRHTADYLSDGTVIRWTDAGTVCQWAQPCGSLERNTLTAAGLAALRALLATDAELLAGPGITRPQPLPGKNVEPAGLIADTFTLTRSDGGRRTVRVVSLTSPDASDWIADPSIKLLNSLAATLVDPATLVGATGLADPTWTPFTPEKAAVFVRFLEIPADVAPTPYRDSSGYILVPLDGSYKYSDISVIGWPFVGTPDTFGIPFTPAPSADSSDVGTAYRCAFLPTADAATGIGRLPASIGATLAAGDLASGVDWRGGGLRWSGKSPTTGFSLAAAVVLPEDAGLACADLQPR